MQDGFQFGFIIELNEIPAQDIGEGLGIEGTRNGGVHLLVTCLFAGH